MSDAYRLADEMKKLTDLGITISVHVDHGPPTSHEFKSEILETTITTRKPCKPAENGFLVREDDEAHFSIVLGMRARSDVLVVIASGEKEKKLSRLSNLSKTEYLTVKRVPTHTIIDGCTTKPADNNFKIISTANNILRVFEVSIATRAYKVEGCLHFLTVQEVYSGQLYYDITLRSIMVPECEYPGYRNWPSLRELVSEMVDAEKLPREVTPVSKEVPPVTEPNRGRVLFFNASTGLGLAKIANNQVAGIHWTKIQTEEPFPYLRSGDEVTFRHSYIENGYTKIVGVEPV